MSLILMARSFERIADHATNICEEVYCLVEGADISYAAFAVSSSRRYVHNVSAPSPNSTLGGREGAVRIGRCGLLRYGTTKM